jgi:hypothetical protein
VLADVSDLDEVFAAAALRAGFGAAGTAFGAAAVVAAGAASTTTAAAVLAAWVALAVTSFTLSTRVSTAIAGLDVAAIFVAFMTFAAFAGLVTARRAVSDALRWVAGAVLLRAAVAFGALTVFLFRISTGVVFLSLEFLRAAAALLFDVPARAIVLALF